MYAEYKKKGEEVKQWTSFDGEKNPGRNYYMFGLLAGVRTEPDEMFPQRGLPDDIGWQAIDDARLFIVDNNDEDQEGYCTLEQALKWEKSGHKIIYQSGKPTWVEHPDWHSHSWLTLAEFKLAMDRFNSKAKEELCELSWMVEYEANIAAMERLEELGRDTRIVFWFDN
jgi:hypothetical protein